MREETVAHEKKTATEIRTEKEIEAMRAETQTVSAKEKREGMRRRGRGHAEEESIPIVRRRSCRYK